MGEYVGGCCIPKVIQSRGRKDGERKSRQRRDKWRTQKTIAVKSKARSWTNTSLDSGNRSDVDGGATLGVRRGKLYWGLGI